MGVPTKFYQIAERNPTDVSGFWKFFHVTLFAVAAVSGFLTANLFSHVLSDFGSHCVLGARIIFAQTKDDVTTTTVTSFPITTSNHSVTTATINDSFAGPTEPMLLLFETTTLEEILRDDDAIIVGADSTITSSSTTPTTTTITTTTTTTGRPNISSFGPRYLIDMTYTRWGSFNVCNLCQFTSVMSLIFGVIWGGFFMLSSKGGAGYDSDILSKPWRILYPSIFFCIAFTIIIIIVNATLSDNLRQFCEQLESELGSVTCNQEVDVYTDQFTGDRSSFSVHYSLLLTCAVVEVIAWVAQCLLLLLRVFCVADFDVEYVTIKERSEDEEVQTIVEYHDFETSFEGSDDITSPV